MNGTIKKVTTMRRMIMALLCSATTIAAFAQNEQDDVMNYRRSSLYSLMINHTDQNFAKEIKEAFMQIPVPDKFNDHDLSVKVLNLDTKLTAANSEKENPIITDFLVKNKVASRLVGRWFNRDSYTGDCNMDLVKAWTL